MDSGWIESSTYARSPDGESHNAYAAVCGLSPAGRDTPGVFTIGGVMPGVICIGSDIEPVNSSSGL